MTTLRGFSADGGLYLLRSFSPAIVVLFTLFLSTAVTSVRFDSEYGLLGVMAAMLTMLMMAPTFRAPPLANSRSQTVGTILLAWAGVLAILLFIGYATKTSANFSRLALFVWILSSGLLLCAVYFWLESLTTWLVVRRNLSRRAVIVGINSTSIELADKLERHPQLGLRVDGFFDDRGGNRDGSELNTDLLGKLTNVRDYLNEHGTDVVFIALPMRHIQRVTDLLDELHDTTASIYFLPDVFVFELIQSQVLTISDIPVVALCETPFFGYRGLVKRLIDVVVGSMALIALSPLLLTTALLVRLTSKGSVIFRQKRYGLDGQEITVFKFRTMRVSDDGDYVKQAVKNDDRLTPIGGFLRKWSIDELPQLFNVLQGSMSLVGPRPHAVAHNEQYRKLIKGYMFRHKVLPGMTGWAQINGFRGGTEQLEDMEGRVQHDLYYLRNWSVGFDLKILFLTVFHVAGAERAY